MPTFPPIQLPSGLDAILSRSRTANVLNDNKVLAVGAVVALALTFIVRYVRSPFRKLPPGPRGLPILGNALSLRSAQWLAFTKWRKTYGDIISISALGQRIVVVNTQKAAADLLDRRAGIYSDRPRNIVAAQILCGGMAIVFQGYSPLWRRMRKAAHEALNRNVAEHFQDTQLFEALVLARDMMKQPSEWDKHLRRTAASMVMSVTYDTPMIESEQDPRVKDVNDFVARLTRSALPGAHFVEFLPWMMHIPSRFAKWKREAEEWYAKDSVMFENLFTGVQDKITKGTEGPSLSGTLIKQSSRYGLSTGENSWLAATMYAAGAETTSAVMAWWTLAMLVYPETQKRAQEELDAVVGRTRIPTFADLPHLPYIRAMVKEALRWRPVDPVGLPHRSTEDDYYEGYFIPKGTIVMANVWSLNRDPDIYGEDAAHFNPARYLDANGQLGPGPEDTKEEGHVTYGFGRRICVGRHVANNSIFIDIAVCLWAFSMGRVKGTELDVDGFVEDGLVVRPKPFEIDVQPRFPEAAAILAEEREMRESKRAEDCNVFDYWNDERAVISRQRVYPRDDMTVPTQYTRI